MLPIAGSEREPGDLGRMALFRVWGARDADGAIQYILAHPDRCFPGLLGGVGWAIAEGYGEAALLWPDRLPPGPYFDAAAAAVASRLSWIATEGAWDLAVRIGDERIRRQALNEIEQARKLKSGEISEGG